MQKQTKDKARQMKRAANGSGTFRWHGNRLEYRVSFTGPDGEKRRKSFSGGNEEECYAKAEAFFMDFEKNMALEANKLGRSSSRTGDGSRTRRAKITMPDLLRHKYELDYKMNYVAEQGYARNMANLKILESSSLGKKDIEKITVEDIERYLMYIVRYSNSVIEKLFLQLRMAYKEAVRLELVSRNLIEYHGIKKPKSSKADRKVRGLTREEQAKLVATLAEYNPVHYTTLEFKKQILIALYTGMRIGEINALSPEDIDFEKNVIHVHKTVSVGVDERLFISDSPKTAAGNRDIPINELVRPVLKEAIEEMKPNRKGLLFYDRYRKTIISTNRTSGYFNRVCEKAGIDASGAHVLRHTFATRCIEAGVKPIVLKTWLGHTDIHVTLDTYADVFDGMNTESMSQYEAYMGVK